MNDPKKLNGWTGPMMVTLAERCTILQILLRHGKYDMSETKQEMAILSTHMVRENLILIAMQIQGSGQRS